MSCCQALVYFLTGRSRRTSCIRLVDSSPECEVDDGSESYGGGDSPIKSDGGDSPIKSDGGDSPIKSDCGSSTLSDEAMPSTLSKYKKELSKQEKRLRTQEREKATSMELLNREVVNSSLDETERRLKEFLRGSDNTTSTDSVSCSSSSESLLNGKRLTSADQLIRRFETRIPVNVLVSYFNEYHASLKKSAAEKEEKNTCSVNEITEELSHLSLSEE